MHTCFMFLSILDYLKCVCYSLFKYKVPYRDRQQAVNIVGNGAPLDKQEHSDHHCYTHTQPRQGMAGNLHTYSDRSNTKNVSFMNKSWWKESLEDFSVCPDLFEETGVSIEAGMSLQYDQDNIWGPAYKSQHHAATQEEPVIGVVVDQALQSVGYQRAAQRDLTRDTQGGIKGSALALANVS